MMDSTTVFLVQCWSGNPDHVMEVLSGTELEKRCQERSKDYFDALPLGPEDCPDCIEDRRAQARRDADYMSWFGCPLEGIDGCKPDCPCKNPEVIEDSPYDNQLRRPKVDAD